MKTFYLTSDKRRVITAIIISVSSIVNIFTSIWKLVLFRFENFNSYSATVTIGMRFLYLDHGTNWSAYQQSK